MKKKRFSSETEQKVIDFLNLVKSAEEISNSIIDDPKNGKDGTAIGLKSADRIIAHRKKSGEFKNLDEVLAISGIGEDKVNDLLYSLGSTKLSAKNYLLLHDEKFQNEISEELKRHSKDIDCTFCGDEDDQTKKPCGCDEEKLIEKSLPVKNGTPGSCNGFNMNLSSFQPTITTPIKRVRVNMVIIQKEDGTNNFNEHDPEHNIALDIAEAQCNFRYRSVDSPGSSNNCNQQAHSRVQFDFRRKYIRHESLWNLDENWTQNNGNPITYAACPNMGGNWPWKNLYRELRDEEECFDEAITVFLVNSGVYLDDIQSVMEYHEQPSGSPQWIVPSPNYSLNNWFMHSPWVGGCSIFPSLNPHSTDRGHVILCKNSFYDYIRSSRIVPNTPGPRATNWFIGSGLGQLLSHEIGHLVMRMSHRSSLGCGANMMQSSGWQSYLDQDQLSRLHRVLSTTDARRCVVEDHPDLIISSNEIWDQNVKVFGNIIVQSGVTLSITCELEMPKDGRIIVERGARLEVLGGRITSRCGFWGSIELRGISKVPHPNLTDVQNGSYPSSSKHHGVVHLVDAVIENAAHAISAIKYETWGANLDYSGGIILAENTRFVNVRRAVEFMKYDFDNISHFVNCSFEIDPTEALYFPFQQLAFITMWAVRGVKFYGNTFANQDSSNSLYPIGERGRGIYSIDAQYQLSPLKLNGSIKTNEFINLDLGVGAHASSPKYLGISIYKALFDNCLHGVESSGVTGITVDGVLCKIGSELSMFSDEFAYGIRLQGCNMAFIQNSTITTSVGGIGSQYGVLVENCENGFNWVYGNTISNITSGVRAIGRNNFLILKCNTFQTSVGDIYLDRDFATGTPGEIASIQSFFPQFGPANNEFTTVTNNCANVGHHIHFDTFAAQSFTYLLPAGSTYTPTCIINGTPNLFSTGLPAYCPKSIFQSKNTSNQKFDSKKLLKTIAEENESNKVNAFTDDVDFGEIPTDQESYLKWLQSLVKRGDSFSNFATDELSEMEKGDVDINDTVKSKLEAIAGKSGRSAVFALNLLNLKDLL